VPTPTRGLQAASRRLPRPPTDPSDRRIETAPLQRMARSPSASDRILIRVLPGGLFSQEETLLPGRPTHRLRPLETTGNRSAPMACGPNVDQGWRGGRLARSCPGRGSLRRFGPPRLGTDFGPDRLAGHGKADHGLDRRSPACKARSGRIATCGASERRRSRPSWCCPWLSARDQSCLL
jgi:hypothetical protein